MRRLAWAGPFVLLAAAVAAAPAQRAVAQFREAGQRATQPVEPPVGYAPPKADAAVVELLDEGVAPLLGLLNNDNSGEQGAGAREDRDVFAGVEAARVTPMQRYASRLPGWGFRIVETPKNAGEFRYLRFAWKKVGGNGIMVQLHDTTKTWFHRYYAGRNVYGWQPATEVAAMIPREWEVVTRDLFKEAGAFTLTGIALTPFDGTAGLFDHVLLGRTVADLDAATDAALGRVKGAKPLAGKERDAAWADAIGTDPKKAAAALPKFLATAPDHVAFVRGWFTDAPDSGGAEQVHALLRDLDADNFDTREAATQALIKLGPKAIDPVREAATGASAEVRFRARVILKELGGGPGTGTGTGPASRAARLSRAVRVLERAGTADARDLLSDIARGKFAPECAADAKAALARLSKTP
ncbi:tolq-type transport protein : Uncharacterized protein OS=Pirellula staleyi (strain ATCC 27377 / DSM 6068 / ICPB 4128) GN=Psta_4371 PE=4 SV=1 [Gemmataceae bacterium]|nr:tolq-type transport protein : Uncharacterized protein OS=Pirellula staleyi (strain ATCC 27377 / DSM 6068 / ICPB 4128) GN=Psta_4371 PE=4 SV=1 [Gemmataceae bacterium]VTT98693.1 tolq-type transport protein : Uncharacterized protein OS=Pirellula staleyi (strain ATCC 27377 / DSM 6068 / ICPB 4128) GN=Psta_4371 PE=4 SV=1 [Gemmataceae bacterium]